MYICTYKHDLVYMYSICTVCTYAVVWRLYQAGMVRYMYVAMYCMVCVLANDRWGLLLIFTQFSTNELDCVCYQFDPMTP